MIDKIDTEILIIETKQQIAKNLLMEEAVKTAGWDKSSVAKFGKTIGHDPDKPGFFDACVAKMSSKFGEVNSKEFCASLKDTYFGDTMWRGKNEK